MKHLPRAQLKIIEQIDGLIESVIEGRSDFVAATISNATRRRYGLSSMTMFDDDFVVIARPGHPIGKLKSPFAKVLATFRWVFSSEGNMFRERLETLFDAHSISLPEPVAKTSSPELIKEIVQSSDCIALNSRMGAREELAAGKLIAIKINSPLMTRSIGLIWRSTHPQPRSARLVTGMAYERLS